MKMEKNGVVKDIESKKVIDRLERQGWKRADATKATTNTGDEGDFDRETTIALLKEAGKNVHPNTGDEKLKAMLEELSA